MRLIAFVAIAIGLLAAYVLCPRPVDPETARRQEAIKIISASRPCTPEQAATTISMVANHKGISEAECVDWFLEQFSRAGVRR